LGIDSDFGFRHSDIKPSQFDFPIPRSSNSRNDAHRMKYSELIQLYFERSNALQWYWTIYVIVIGGLLAFSSIRQRRDRVTTALVTVLYAFFAYKNLGAIHDVTIQRLAVVDLIRSAPVTTEIVPIRTELEPTMDPPPYEGIRNFHVASDVLTIAAVWTMERRRRLAAVASAA
jgi:hypothetical protein